MNYLQQGVLVAAEQLKGNPLYFQLASSLFAGKGSSKEFSEVLEADIQQKLHKHILDIGGSILQAEHGQPYPFSAIHSSIWNILKELKTMQDVAEKSKVGDESMEQLICSLSREFSWPFRAKTQTWASYFCGQNYDQVKE